ncbi:MAG: DUF3822 family protein [Bacteroidales bacterium]|nr:DUF3822 family protein [Bacteroidales bacterium]
MSKYTIVPSAFFAERDAHSLLSELVELTPNDRVKHIELPEFKAVLLYCNTLPPVKKLLDLLPKISDYNKMIVEVSGGEAHLVLAAGEKLLLVNSYKVPDFTTALYFIFAALKEFQINPEMTTFYHFGELAYEQKELLFRYFLGVEEIR